MPPSISGDQFDITQTVTRMLGNTDNLRVWINGSSELKKVHFSTDLKTQEAFGLPVMDFDFIQMDAQTKSDFSSLYKIDCIDNGGDDGVWKMLITFSGELMEFLEPEIFSFKINVEDSNGYKKERTLDIEITNAYVRTEDIQKTGGAWATKAYLKGTILNPDITEYYFQYKKVGELAYTDVKNVDLDGIIFTAKIDNLDPNTQYQFRAVGVPEVGDDYFAEDHIFTTEKAIQLPNSSFENWTTQSGSLPPLNMPNTWVVPHGADEEKFWDSGNMGAIAANAQLTFQEISNLAVDGESIAKLESKKAELMNVGRFAAGNIFIGEFEEVIATLIGASRAGGKLSFGREFTSRPTSLRGWYHYTNGGAISLDNNVTIPADVAADGAVAGNPDKAVIYIALSDKGTPYSIVNTTLSNNTLSYFDKDDENIIAYGELVQEENTPGSALVQFNIPLKYRFTDRIPTHIIIVCSSSKYGDYFAGAVGSILLLDNFELIYE